jgi:predicted ArsR family transcriptional regulator
MTRKTKTKVARVEEMLRKPDGATIAALCKATGWQSHSVRAALTGLRKKGHVLDRSPGAGDQPTVYRISGGSDEAPQ